VDEVAHDGESTVDLTKASETLMRFGTSMLRAGDTAFRVSSRAVRARSMIQTVLDWD
jgi:hypothetical protein